MLRRENAMNSIQGAPVLPTGTASRPAPPQLSLFRLYTLRLAYLILAAGLAAFIWPDVIHHTSALATRLGVQLALLAAIGATAALGLRYPVQMLPILIFEFTWKTIYLIAFALPLWRAHQITPPVADDIKNIAGVVVLLPLVPWIYVFKRYVLAPGDRWK